MALERAEKAVPGVITAVHNVLTDPALMEEIIAEMVPLYARTYTAESMKISNRVMVPRIQKMTQQITENFATP